MIFLTSSAMACIPSLLFYQVQMTRRPDRLRQIQVSTIRNKLNN